MSNLPQIFNYQDKQIRTVLVDKEPWFVAKDVCEVLEITDTWSAVSRLSEKMKGTDTISTLGGNQEMNIISEAGVYKIVFTSRKPEAEKFTDWVTSEVLPAIRKYGTYMTPETIEQALADPDTIIKIATQLKIERQKRAEAEKQIEQSKPLVSFAETCMKSKDSLLVRELAKLASDQGITIGEKRLYKKLRDWGLIIKKKTEPTQKAMSAGYFEVSQGVNETPYGTKIWRVTRVTPRGQIYIIEKLKKEDNA